MRMRIYFDHHHHQELFTVHCWTQKVAYVQDQQESLNKEVLVYNSTLSELVQSSIQEAHVLDNLKNNKFQEDDINKTRVQKAIYGIKCMISHTNRESIVVDSLLYLYSISNSLRKKSSSTITRTLRHQLSLEGLETFA